MLLGHKDHFVTKYCQYDGYSHNSSSKRKANDCDAVYSLVVHCD